MRRHRNQTRTLTQADEASFNVLHASPTWSSPTVPPEAATGTACRPATCTSTSARPGSTPSTSSNRRSVPSPASQAPRVEGAVARKSQAELRARRISLGRWSSSAAERAANRGTASKPSASKRRRRSGERLPSSETSRRSRGHPSLGRKSTGGRLLATAGHLADSYPLTTTLFTVRVRGSVGQPRDAMRSGSRRSLRHRAEGPPGLERSTRSARDRLITKSRSCPTSRIARRYAFKLRDDSPNRCRRRISWCSASADGPC